MRTIITSTALLALMFGLYTTGVFAADRLDASNNRITQSNSGARAQQVIRIGVMDAPVFGSARVNASNNNVTQTNSHARAKQRLEIGVVK